MGILDFLFGKKVEIELTNECGKTFKKTIAKKDLKRLVIDPLDNDFLGQFAI